MSNTIVALLVGAGLSAWVYSKTMRSTGNNTQNSLIAAGAAGFVAFILMWIIMGFIPQP